MTFTSWPYVAQDTTDIEYGYLFREFQPDGVVGSIGDSALKPFGDSSGMQIKIPTGSAVIRGYMFRCTAQEIIAVTTAHASLARKDRVVLELNLSAPTIPERIKPKVVAGTAGSGSAPALVTSDTGVHQLSLAIIDVDAGATTIAAGKVTDDRSFTGMEVGQWANDGKRPSSPRKYQLGFNENRGYYEFWTGSAWTGIADWAGISNKPTTFTPSAHSHAIADVTDLSTQLAAKAPKDNPTFTGTITGNLQGEVNGIYFYSQSGTPTTPAPQNGDVWFSGA